jgi:ABC-type multidrug transport system permease subunit
MQDYPNSVQMALIISSLYFNLSTDTNSFYGRSVVLFVAILFNAFASMLEILTLYAQRPIVEKQPATLSTILPPSHMLPSWSICLRR